MVYAISYPKIVESKLELGMDKSEVISLIASNNFDDTTNLKKLCSTNQWQGCKSALSSGSATYLSWSVGIDTFIVVGFNKNNKLIYKSFGDT